MKVAWLTNSLLPEACKHLNIVPTNKEGWLVGLLDSITSSEEDDFELAVISPVPTLDMIMSAKIGKVMYYTFLEDINHPEIYDESVTYSIGAILELVRPDMVHIFGTEYAHTLSMTKAFNRPEKTLIGMQGVVGEIYKHYADDVPTDVIERRTFRDFLKKDGLKDQINKFGLRTEHEKEALKNVAHVTGRTDFDRNYMLSVNDKLTYHFMNETLKKAFYDGKWEYEKCEKHSIFLSQADYPVKGAHYLFKACGSLVSKYPDLKIYIAGNPIIRTGNIKEKLKLPSYGKYLKKLIKENGLTGKVVFTGNVSIEEMKRLYLKSNVFVCASTIENSSNSVGEAMLLSVPTVASDVGGIRNLLDDQKDGIIYKAGDIKALGDAIERMFTDASFREECSKNAHEHAMKTQDPDGNVKILREIYKSICR